MFLTRILSEEDRKKIKEIKRKESLINGYQVDTTEKFKRGKRRGK